MLPSQPNVDASSIAPELMAPAGDWDCAKAAVANGADAVYFGLQGGLNARGRAVNFAPAELADFMAFLHVRGLKGYLTLNTLVFGHELEEAERVVRLAGEGGVDAVLVQDLGLARLAHRCCPELPLHASTQMTLSSAECIAEVASLGIRRVVLPRELSIDQIAAIRRQTNVELEVFVHGALCVSYSGQCLASLAFGGRSGNRGQCAQPCRLPYDVICDGRPLGLDTMRYPMSTQDLAAYDRLPQLIAAGVSALKIEGRLKPPEYVAAVTRYYRRAIDAASSQQGLGTSVPSCLNEQPSTAELEQTFSRGFCHGWLDGPLYPSLVSGTSSAKRGTPLGEVLAVRGERIRVHLSAPLERGDGVVFDGDRAEGTEVGGRVYEIFQRGRPMKDAAAGQSVELAFRRGTMESADIRAGQKLWKTDDPRAARRLRQSYADGLPSRRVAVDIIVEAVVGSTLRVTAKTAIGAVCHLESPEVLAEAVKHPLDEETLRHQFSRLGNTPFALRRFEAKIDGRAMAPLSVLGLLRKEMISRLEAESTKPVQRHVLNQSALTTIRAEERLAADGTSAPAPSRAATVPPENTTRPPQLHVLCRSVEQLKAALACSVSSLIADFRQLDLYRAAVAAARGAGAMILLATPRIHKPDDRAGQGGGPFDAFVHCQPDGLLVRNLAGLAFCRRAGLMAVADFSLNASNDLTTHWLHERGASRVTASYDLSRQQLLELAATVPADWLEVIAHRHIPLFHAEYCLFCRTLSQGNNRTDCRRPCIRHKLRLRDRLGVEHPVVADSQCRNTVFHRDAENLADVVPALLERGVRHFRIELGAEATAEEVRRIVAEYGRLLRTTDGGQDACSTNQEARVIER